MGLTTIGHHEKSSNFPCGRLSCLEKVICREQLPEMANRLGWGKGDFRGALEKHCKALLGWSLAFEKA